MNPYELELNVICWFYENEIRRIEEQTLSWTFFFDTEEEYLELKERLDKICNKHSCSSLKEYFELLLEIDDISNENYVITDLGRTIEFSVETEKMKREKEQLKKERLEKKNKKVLFNGYTGFSTEMATLVFAYSMKKDNIPVDFKDAYIKAYATILAENKIQLVSFED